MLLLYYIILYYIIMLADVGLGESMSNDVFAYGRSLATALLLLLLQGQLSQRLRVKLCSQN